MNNFWKGFNKVSTRKYNAFQTRIRITKVEIHIWTPVFFFFDPDPCLETPSRFPVRNPFSKTVWHPFFNQYPLKLYGILSWIFLFQGHQKIYVGTREQFKVSICNAKRKQWTNYIKGRNDHGVHKLTRSIFVSFCDEKWHQPIPEKGHPSQKCGFSSAFLVISWTRVLNMPVKYACCGSATFSIGVFQGEKMSKSFLVDSYDGLGYQTFSTLQMHTFRYGFLHRHRPYVFQTNSLHIPTTRVLSTNYFAINCRPAYI